MAKYNVKFLIEHNLPKPNGNEKLDEARKNRLVELLKEARDTHRIEFSNKGSSVEVIEYSDWEGIEKEIRRMRIEK